MNFQIFLIKGATALFAGVFMMAVAASAQQLVVDGDRGPIAVATGNNLYCAGYVQSSSVDTSNKIIGAENEQDGFVYAQGNHLYINQGSSAGARVGDMYSVIRPRGRVDAKLSRKGSLGIYVQEVGAVEVIKVSSNFSVVRIKTSCDTFQLGDLVQPTVVRVSPMFADRPALDVFRDPTGKANGRIFHARDNQEMLGKEQIVYIDLGQEDSVRVGDYLTIYRPLGKGNLSLDDKWETVAAQDNGFSSVEYKGGNFSNQAGRKSGSNARGSVVTNADAKEGRPDGLRKVVGEMVILNVKERTATALITRAAQEVHTGDWVEIQ